MHIKWLTLELWKCACGVCHRNTMQNNLIRFAFYFSSRVHFFGSSSSSSSSSMIFSRFFLPFISFAILFHVYRNLGGNHLLNINAGDFPKMDNLRYLWVYYSFSSFNAIFLFGNSFSWRSWYEICFFFCYLIFTGIFAFINWRCSTQFNGNISAFASKLKRNNVK